MGRGEKVQLPKRLLNDETKMKTIKLVVYVVNGLEEFRRHRHVWPCISCLVPQQPWICFACKLWTWIPGFGMLVFLIRLYLSESWAMVILPRARDWTWLPKNIHRTHTLCSHGMFYAVLSASANPRHERALQLDLTLTYSNGFDTQ